ncbi:MBL fold metallo-hydrolase [Flammeovirga kamogawensis]|uniref:MBL fold metallo-hydrolase n=1 Tax=Flammeovirga kamogawensis TaxID=373891 RepID=A0ABX8GWT7_9BACT|nr:MBL fold metallo-hydrolase [Flammeovirga kamogawensis]MBB6461306.1 glyoxylase-like metal-dependent hydrolase (beta-lactamase superfamily II) [Flammeovirga kamogawensis]QWG07863.1 MBL fold metallo-hydrolase [Flammeovirga kamogawensis]TRX69670.1 MBL fold metallo-hydrolase [Flammeovirga kamogawensis]
MSKVKSIDLHFLNKEDAIASYLVETSEGPILIETGPHSTFSILKKALADKGYNPEDIKHVFITHIHLDHAGAAWKFAEHGAKIYLHPFGERHMADPSKLMSSAKMIYKDDMDRLWGRMEAIPKECLCPIAHEDEVVIGDTVIKAWHTPGHANHHIAWQIGEGLFTGDVAGVKINNGPVVAPCPPPDINLEKWQSSIDLIRKISPAVLYLTHFGAVTDIDKHLIALEKDLYQIAQIVKKYTDDGLDVPEMEKRFIAYVNQELSNYGLDQNALEQYDAANPPFMGVAGLVRYWKKKNEL